MKKALVLLSYLFVLVSVALIPVKVSASEIAADKVENVKYSLEAPVIESITATSKATIKITWEKVAHADEYQIMRASKKTGKYEKIGSTSKLSYTDKSGKQLKTYYYKIVATYQSEGGAILGKESKIKKITVRKIAKKVAYVGDSVMTGFSLYHVIKNTKQHKVFAKVGVGTSNFYSGPLMSSLVSYNPDRMFIMLGINGLPGRVNDSYQNTIIASYHKILKKCIAKNKNMEIIVVGVGPVGRGANVSMSSVRLFNKKLKKMVKAYKNNAHYMDLNSVLADQGGYLKGSCSGGDGIHWKAATYSTVLKAFHAFAKEF